MAVTLSCVSLMGNVLIGHLSTSLGEMSLEILCSFEKLAYLSFCCCRWITERIQWENAGKMCDPRPGARSAPTKHWPLYFASYKVSSDVSEAEE